MTMTMRIDYKNITPISDKMAKIKIKTIDGKGFIMKFITEEDMRNMPLKVTVDKVIGISRMKKVV